MKFLWIYQHKSHSLTIQDSGITVFRIPTLDKHKNVLCHGRVLFICDPRIPNKIWLENLLSETLIHHGYVPIKTKVWMLK